MNRIPLVKFKNSGCPAKSVVWPFTPISPTTVKVSLIKMVNNGLNLNIMNRPKITNVKINTIRETLHDE